MSNNAVISLDIRRQAPNAEHSALTILLDDVKQINDSLGHQVGEEVLRYVAKVLLPSFRADALLARFSAPDASGEERPATMPTLSCGVSEDSAGDTPASMFQRADEAHYAAKRQGKNRVVSKQTRLLRDQRH